MPVILSPSSRAPTSLAPPAQRDTSDSPSRSTSRSRCSDRAKSRRARPSRTLSSLGPEARQQHLAQRSLSSAAGSGSPAPVRTITVAARRAPRCGRLRSSSASAIVRIALVEQVLELDRGLQLAAQLAQHVAIVARVPHRNSGRACSRGRDSAGWKATRRHDQEHRLDHPRVEARDRAEQRLSCATTSR